MATASPSLLDRLQLGLGARAQLVLQTEASECGLACLAMVLNHHGTVTDLPTLRSRHGAMPQGMTLTEIIRVAQAEQLTARAVRLEVDELNQLRLPCILHWDLGHFVVLHKVGAERCEVLDPAVGECSFTLKDISTHFSGVALEVWPGDSFAPRQEGQRISLQRLVGRVAGLWTTVWRVLAVSLALEVLTLISPLFMQWVVDHVVISRDLDLLGTLAVGFVLVLLMQQFLTVVRSWLLLRVSTQLRVQWRSNVLAHLMRLPLDYFARRHLGDVMSRFDSISKIQKVLTSTFVEVALDGLMVLMTLVLMLLYSPRLTAVAVLSVALYAGIRLAWYGPLKRATSEHLVRSASESSHLLETVRGMRTIRLFARNTERLGAWQSLMVSDVNADLRVQKLDIIYLLLRRLLSGAFALLLLGLGARDVIAGTMSVGMLLAFLAYRGQFDSRFTELVNKYFDLRMLGLDAQRLADIVLTPAEPNTVGQPMALRTGAPDIQIQNLSFRYAQGSPDVLEDLDLHIPAGQSVAIAGPSGCGKTTLVNLIMGVYLPQRGSIKIDGLPITTMGLEQWRMQVGTVMQDDVLFAGSIADNICFFDPQANRPWIEECARMASIHDDIMRLAMGYQTLVGDMGTTLSGGQKQRVLLARAMYRRPRVLILDEATSHLDVAREAEVGRAIARMAITRIVVAHRPQTLATVDRVVEMADGRIVRDERAADYAKRLAMLSGVRAA
jgi:ATP-binding cassette, subfamily B, bacterial CvaB/MchF/RaxB